MHDNDGKKHHKLKKSIPKDATVSPGTPPAGLYARKHKKSPTENRVGSRRGFSVCYIYYIYTAYFTTFLPLTI